MPLLSVFTVFIVGFLPCMVAAEPGGVEQNTALDDPGDYYYENFDSGDNSIRDRWHIDSGKWQVIDGKLLSDSTKGEAFIFFGNNLWQNYIIEVNATFVRVNNESRWSSILFRAGRNGEKPFSQFPVRYKSTLPNGAEFAVKTQDGWHVKQTSSTADDCSLGKPRSLRVIVRGNEITGFLDGQAIVKSDFCIERDTGAIGLGSSGCVVEFDDFKVTRLADTPAIPARANPTSVQIISHRGFCRDAPENTIASIAASAALGVEGCEFDLRLSRDNKTVIIHDQTVNRTTNGKGLVSDLTSTQIKRLDAGSWKNPDYAAEKVPDLQDALACLKGTGQTAIIDIKDNAAIVEMVRCVRAASMARQTVALSSDTDTLRRIKSLDPDIQRAWLCDGFPKKESSSAKRIQWLYDQIKYCDAQIVNLNYKLLRPELIAVLRRMNIEVWAWTVNDADTMKWLMRWNIDAITTDRPDLLKQIRLQSRNN